MASKIITTSAERIFLNVNNNSAAVVMIIPMINDMVKEFGVSKTQDAIQALYDNDRIDQQTAGFLLDDLKIYAGKQQAARMFLL